MILSRPEWSLPPRVRAAYTTRQGGISRGSWASLNLGLHCGDDSEAVAENLRRLSDELPASPRWLRQVHGTGLIHLDDWQSGIEADAAWTDRPGQVCAILTADCLPILLAHTDGVLVAAVHAGWRGLAAGVIEQTIAQLPVDPTHLSAWIGPGISQSAYEVSDAVRADFVDGNPALKSAFESSRPGHFLADLKAIARQRLTAAGLSRIVDAKLCTAAEPDRFFSYRRDQGRTGRQAGLIWLESA